MTKARAVQGGSPFMARRGAPAIAALASLTALAGCAPGLLDPAGPVAAGEKQILLNSLVIMLGIVVPVIVLTLVFAWWFRAGNARARHLPEWSYSGRLELLVWSIPALVIIFLGGIAWIGSHDLDPPKPIASRTAPLRVEVIALDWRWLFVYPDQGIATINRLVVPASTPIAFRVTSATVMNSFFVPRLGSQIYAMAGMETKLHLMADRPGRYRGISAHYSGEGFSDMHFDVDAVPASAFAAWVANTRAAAQAPVLDARTYLMLARQRSTKGPIAFRAVSPGLFDAAVKQAGVPAHETAHDGRER